MACQKISYYLDDYLSGDLPSRDRMEIDSHLASCPECKAMLTEHRKFLAVLQESKIPDPGEDYWLALEKSVFSRTIDSSAANVVAEYRKPFIKIWRYLPAVAAVIILMFFALSGKPQFPSAQLRAGTVTQLAYDPELIGGYYLGSNYTGDEVGIMADLIEAVPLSAPGSAGYNLAMIMQLHAHLGGRN